MKNSRFLTNIWSSVTARWSSVIAIWTTDLAYHTWGDNDIGS